MDRKFMSGLVEFDWSWIFVSGCVVLGTVSVVIKS